MRALACQSSVSVQRIRKKKRYQGYCSSPSLRQLATCAALFTMKSKRRRKLRIASSSLFKDPSDAELWPTLISLLLRHSVGNHLSSPTCHLGGHIKDVLRNVLSFSHATRFVCSSAMDKERRERQRGKLGEPLITTRSSHPIHNDPPIQGALGQRNRASCQTACQWNILH
jgi:hypothetical protein